MRWNVRSQFLLPPLLLVLGLAGVSTWTALESARAAKRRIAGDTLGIFRTLSNATFPLNQKVLDQMHGLSGAEYLLLDRGGERIATFSGYESELPPTSPLSADSESTIGDRIVVDNRVYLCRGVALRPPHLNAGSKLYVLYPESQLNEAVWQAVRPTLILGISAGVAAFALTAIGAHRLVRRIREVERRTRQIAAGDFSPMPLPQPDDELRELAQSVNEMAAQLAVLNETVTRTERERLLGQIAGGLAHQLRNAVTGAKLAVQLHAQTCAGGDAEALDVADRQLARMAVDLQQFLDRDRWTAQTRTCSMSHIVSEAVSLLAPQCRHARTQMNWPEPKEPFSVAGDAGQLAHLVLNLLTNAIEAAGPEGRVDVRLRRDSDRGILEISDTGPGPPSAIANSIFEPFVTGKPEGIGLGLAVARDIVQRHGGTIAWNRIGNETTFRVDLPLTTNGTSA